MPYMCSIRCCVKMNAQLTLASPITLGIVARKEVKMAAEREIDEVIERELEDMEFEAIELDDPSANLVRRT